MPQLAPRCQRPEGDTKNHPRATAIMLRTLITLEWVTKGSDGCYRTSAAVSATAHSPTLAQLCADVYSEPKGTTESDTSAEAWGKHLPQLAVWLERLIKGLQLPAAATDVSRLLTMVASAVIAPTLLELRMIDFCDAMALDPRGALTLACCCGRVSLCLRGGGGVPLPALGSYDAVVDAVLDILAMEGERIAPTTPLMDAGVDSIASASFAASVLARTGLAIEPTVIFEHPTAEAVAVHLARRLGLDTPSTPRVVSRPANGPSKASLGIGAATQQWPGGCTRAAALRALLHAGGDTLGSPPAQRWVLEAEVDPSTLSLRQFECIRHGGYVDAERFDSAAFSLSPAEVGWMDPQQRLLLEVGFASLHDHGMRRAALLGSDVGHFLGMSKGDWSRYQYARRGGYAKYSVYATTCDSNTVASGRLSFALGLHGPCMTVDTACSSALVALHTARLNIHAGECEMAAVTAVRLELTLQHTLDAAFASMLSLNGRCFTLDRRADGYVSSEGVCAVVVDVGLEKEENEEAQLVTVFDCAAIRCDGRSASLTAPNGTAQAAMMAVVNVSMGGSSAACIELHGTGTALGDPIEMSALTTVMARSGGASSITVGGAKASFGHTMAASGLLGVCKVLLQTEGAFTPPNTQLRILNGLVASAVNKLRPASLLLTQSARCTPSTSGVSSFGYSGTIAHVRLSRPKKPPSAKRPARRVPLRCRRTPFAWVKRTSAFGSTPEPASQPSLAMFSTCWVGVRDGASDLASGPRPWRVLALHAAAPQPALTNNTVVDRVKGLTSSQLGALSVTHDSIAVLLDSDASANPSQISAQVVVQVVRSVVALDAGHRLLLLTFGLHSVMAGTCPAPISIAAHGGCSGLLCATHKEYAAAQMLAFNIGHVHTMPALDGLVGHTSVEWSQAQSGSLQLAPRLRCAMALPPHAHLSLCGEGFLVTGGLGGLGLRAGELLQDAGASLVLTSRSGRVPRDGQNLEHLLGSLLAKRALSLVCDVQEGTHVLEGFRSQHITGVVHAAGVSTNAPLIHVDLAQLNTAYAPKALGAAHIHSTTATSTLRVMVALSSVSTFWCRVGQACYAAANAFLDALAPRQRGQGQSGLSLSLPGVEGVGMGAALGVRRTIQMSLVEYDAALAALMTTVASSTNAVRPVLPSTLERFVPGAADGRNPLLHEVAGSDKKCPAAAALLFALPLCPDPSLKMEEPQLAARIAQISPALHEMCKARLPAASVEAAIVAMGTLFSRKPRPDGPRLVRVAVSAGAGAAVVELCDEERSNTISHELAADVAEAAASIRRHGGIRTVALYGKGAHFSVGVNPYNYSSSDARASLAASAHSCELLLAGFVQLRGLSLPFTCAVHGKLIGAALAASLNADYIVAHADASFCHGNIVRGVCPLGMLSQTLVSSVGCSRALHMYLTNETIGSAHAMSIALVHEVIDEVPRTQQRATDVAWLFTQHPQDAAALVCARDPIDHERIAAEAYGHASCLEANGGRYANSELLGPNDEMPTGFVRMPLTPADGPLADDVPAAVHHAEVPVTLAMDVLEGMCQWPGATLLVIRGMAASDNFCLGGDPSIARLKSGDFLRDVPAFARLFEHLQRRMMPTIVVSHGATRGFGMVFPCMGTIVLAHADATFGFVRNRRPNPGPCHDWPACACFECMHIAPASGSPRCGVACYRAWSASQHSGASARWCVIGSFAPGRPLTPRQHTNSASRIAWAARKRLKQRLHALRSSYVSTLLA